MTYHRRHPGLGDVSSVIQQITSGVGVAVDISRDPYLPETICRAQQLVALENKHAVPVCNATRPNLQGGIGLRSAMPVLRGYVYAKQNPWVYPVAAAAMIGVPVLIGYLLGKGSRR